jgi:membrane-bound lytic murein transglycosylase A
MGKRLIIVSLLLFVVGCQKSNNQNLSPKNDKQERMCAVDAEVLRGESLVDSKDTNTQSEYITPTVKLSESEWPELADDLDFAGMELALQRQLIRFKALDLNKKIRLGSDYYKLKQAKLSLEKFKDLLNNYKKCSQKEQVICRIEFTDNMHRFFNAYIPRLEKGDPRYKEEKSTMFTAYYTPEILAKVEKTDEFKYAIYARPQKTNQVAFSRVEIDFRGALENHNLEMFYTNDLFSLYLLHIEGGGHVKVLNRGYGSSAYISYDGTNGQSWNFISKYMRKNNMITDGSTAAQRQYLENNPDRQEEIYASCPSYVYFKKTIEPPLGSDSVPLTDNRSIATDNSYYKFKGLLAYVVAQRPIENMNRNLNCRNRVFQPYSRFYLDQDTGGAIRGKARADLYFGEGEYAERAAHNLVQRGDLYFFMLK